VAADKSNMRVHTSKLCRSYLSWILMVHEMLAFADMMRKKITMQAVHGCYMMEIMTISLMVSHLLLREMGCTLLWTMPQSAHHCLVSKSLLRAYAGQGKKRSKDMEALAGSSIERLLFCELVLTSCVNPIKESIKSSLGC